MINSALKYFIVAVICGILLIPVLFISNMVRERESRSYNAIDEVAAKWGKDQIIAGPFVSSSNNQSTHFYLFPDQIEISSKLTNNKKKRGIYTVDLYSADILVKGKFANEDYYEIKEENSVDINFIISDIKGLTDEIKVKVDGIEYDCKNGILNDDLGRNGFHFKAPYKDIKGKSFEITLKLNGSQSISFAALGKTNSIKMNANWKDPSFFGHFLPTNHQIDNNGFEAEWKVLSINKNSPQAGMNGFVNFNNNNQYNRYSDVNDMNYDENSSNLLCSTRLIKPVSDYVKARRSNEYAFFLLIIVFAALFFSEYLSKSKIHLIQYLIIGFAIVLFYLFLLALSEHIGFNNAYFTSVLMVVVPTFFYTKSILKNLKAALSITFLTLLLYGMFYIMLLSQDYALLIGAVLAFIIMLGVMFITKNFNQEKEVSV